MSWGYKIAILYLGFVTMIISLVFLSSASQADLERPDYYEAELRHGEKMDAIKNLDELGEDIVLKHNGEQLVVHHPKVFETEQATVKLWLYFAGDSRNDKKITYSCQGDYLLHTADWPSGIYLLRFDISSTNKNYFSEKQLTLK